MWCDPTIHLSPYLHMMSTCNKYNIVLWIIIIIYSLKKNIKPDKTHTNECFLKYFQKSSTPTNLQKRKKWLTLRNIFQIISDIKQSLRWLRPGSFSGLWYEPSTKHKLSEWWSCRLTVICLYQASSVALILPLSCCLPL